MSDLSSRREQWRFGDSTSNLSIPHSSHQAVAYALSSFGLFGGATLLEEIIDGFRGTSVTDGSIRLAIEVPQITEVAHPGARHRGFSVSGRAWENDNLKWETGRRGLRIGEHARLAEAAQPNYLLLHLRRNP